MARASFFLTRTDADSIKARQLKSGLTLVFLVLVDATATLWLFFTREGKLGALVPELRGHCEPVVGPFGHVASGASQSGGVSHDE